MGEQIHKRLVDEQMKAILGRYVAKEMTAAHAMELLGLRRRQFFEWVQRYKSNPEGLTVEHQRKQKGRKIGDAVETHILAELAIEKALIDDPSVPVRFYNYSYIQDQIRKNYREKVSLPTIIDRAKKTAFISPGLRGPSMTTRSSRTTQESLFNMMHPTIDGLHISPKSFTS